MIVAPSNGGRQSVDPDASPTGHIPVVSRRTLQEVSCIEKTGYSDGFYIARPFGMCGAKEYLYGASNDIFPNRECDTGRTVR
ncbi:hypothetical protein GCM10007377_01930 [Galliscardovia ingluviei]|uniref:Uncharacterized protein n=1 Tax=Galliscardovia ingluviei TaxID=1769422 RepID=A0A8J3AKI2_9BIFI|nr:hypothetical protein GCM10007377_01930 [Galliscardovia ingluviei]